MKVEANLFDKYNQCIDDVNLERTSQSKISLRENKRKYLLENDSGFYITKFRVENCISIGEGKKGCEAILYIEDLKRKDYFGIKAFFVELKGCSVKDAIKQLDNSFEITKQYLKGVVLFGRIVPSQYKRTHFLRTVEQKLHLKFKSTGGDLIIKEILTDKI